MECPLCGHTKFVDFRGRGIVRCAGCGSVPRTRITWLLLRDYAGLQPGARVAHFAPELPLTRRLVEHCGAGYEAYDFDPQRYRANMALAPVTQCDLCTDLGRFEPGAYDAVVHNHVMEHVPCNYVMILLGLQRLLKPGGTQVFSVPITGGTTKSDFDLTMGMDSRQKRFGQWDHLVKFGAADHDAHLGMVFGQTNERYRLEDLIAEEVLVGANVPQRQWRPAGSTVFAVRRDA